MLNVKKAIRVSTVAILLVVVRTAIAGDRSPGERWGGQSQASRYHGHSATGVQTTGKSARV